MPQNQQYISQGLNKLRESLVNFRVEESSSVGDLYVYTNKSQNYLLKLEEIYESTLGGGGGQATGAASGQGVLSTSQQNQSLLTIVSSSMLIDNENSIVTNDNVCMIDTKAGQQHKLGKDQRV